MPPRILISSQFYTMQIKTIITLLVLLCALQTKANYVVCLNEEQASEAMLLLSKQQEIYYSQEATQLEEYSHIEIDTLFLVEKSDCRAIFLKGHYLNNKKRSNFEQELDLASTWIQKDKIGINLAFQLNIPLIYAPVDPFYWKNLKPCIKEANRENYKIASTLVDSISHKLTLPSEYNIYDINGRKIKVDSVICDFNLENSELVIHQYFGDYQEKRYLINLKQCFEISLKEYGGQKSLYINGANYKQFYKRNELKNSLAFLFLRVHIPSQTQEDIVDQFQRLIYLVQHYNFYA